MNEIANLKSVVADRIWNAWWRPYGHALPPVLQFIEDLPKTRSIPFCMVAHHEGEYCGSVLATTTDLDERPQLSPWVAALWVEPGWRKQGIASALVQSTLHEIFVQGHPTAYLYATLEKRDLYQKMGWHLSEQNVGDDHVDVFTMNRSE